MMKMAFAHPRRWWLQRGLCTTALDVGAPTKWRCSTYHTHARIVLACCWGVGIMSASKPHFPHPAFYLSGIDWDRVGLVPVLKHSMDEWWLIFPASKWGTESGKRQFYLINYCARCGGGGGERGGIHIGSIRWCVSLEFSAMAYCEVEGIVFFVCMVLLKIIYKHDSSILLNR